MITRRSRLLASRTSRLIAVLPPTRMSGLTGPARCADAGPPRSPRVSRPAPSAWPGPAPCRRQPSAVRRVPAERGRRTDAVDLRSRSCTTWSAWAAGVRIWTGVPAPAGKCWASTCWPVTDSTLSRNRSACEMPLALNVGRNAAQASSASALTTQTRRVRARPARRRGPRACGRRPGRWRARGRGAGSTARRSAGRTASRTAGRKVIAASSAPAMPIAPTGPRPLVLPSSDSSRQSSPRMTVAALAAIGSIARAPGDAASRRTCSS